MLIHLVVFLGLAESLIEGVSVHKVNYRVSQGFYIVAKFLSRNGIDAHKFRLALDLAVDPFEHDVV